MANRAAHVILGIILGAVVGFVIADRHNAGLNALTGGTRYSPGGFAFLGLAIGAVAGYLVWVIRGRR